MVSGVAKAPGGCGEAKAPGSSGVAKAPGGSGWVKALEGFKASGGVKAPGGSGMAKARRGSGMTTIEMASPASDVPSSHVAYRDTGYYDGILSNGDIAVTVAHHSSMNLEFSSKHFNLLIAGVRCSCVLFTSKCVCDVVVYTNIPLMSGCCPCSHDASLLFHCCPADAWLMLG